MRFDPKLIRPDEPPLAEAGELRLPDDLAALAEQLGEDAARLAACYPPQRAAVLPRPAAGTRSGKRTMLAVAGSVSVVATLALAVWWNWPVARPAMSDVAAVDRGADDARWPTEKAKPASPTISLSELSGPELEALFDLWQRDSGQVVSVSF